MLPHVVVLPDVAILLHLHPDHSGYKEQNHFVANEKPVKKRPSEIRGYAMKRTSQLELK